MTENYKKRIADKILADRLEGAGAVLVEGAKWCGKTTTCEQVAKSILYMGDSDSKKKMKAPAFRMVLTAVGEVVYRRKEDGVLVVPIGCLRP